MGDDPGWWTDPVDEDRGRWFASGRWTGTVARPEHGEWTVEEDAETKRELTALRRPTAVWAGLVAIVAGIVTPAVTLWAMGPLAPDPGDTCAYRPQVDPTGMLAWWLLWLGLALLVVVGGRLTHKGARRMRPERRTRWYRIAAWAALLAPPLWWLALYSGAAMNCGM